jgi:hypothetical protein
MAQRSETPAHQRSKIVQPTNGQKIVKVTVLPIKRFALMKSHVFVDVIEYIYKGKGMAPTNVELIGKKDHI